MIPPVPYYGSKARIAQQIALRFPPHTHYVEVFGGSLAVLLAKDRSQNETVNDLDRELVTFWRVLRDRPQELALNCGLTPHSRYEHAQTREPLDIERYAAGEQRDLEIARRVYVALTQGRQGKRTPTGWAYRVQGTANMPASLHNYAVRLIPAAARLSHVTLECWPWQEIVGTYGRDPDTLLYVDPPYPGDVRTTTTGYRHEMPTREEHAELLDALRAARAAVVLSGYRCPQYDAALRDWYRHEFPTRTGPAGTRPAVEMLWSNRPFAYGTQPDLLDRATWGITPADFDVDIARNLGVPPENMTPTLLAELRERYRRPPGPFSGPVGA